MPTVLLEPPTWLIFGLFVGLFDLFRLFWAYSGYLKGRGGRLLDYQDGYIRYSVMRLLIQQTVFT